MPSTAPTKGECSSPGGWGSHHRSSEELDIVAGVPVASRSPPRVERAETSSSCRATRWRLSEASAHAEACRMRAISARLAPDIGRAVARHGEPRRRRRARRARPPRAGRAVSKRRRKVAGSPITATLVASSYNQRSTAIRASAATRTESRPAMMKGADQPHPRCRPRPHQPRPSSRRSSVSSRLSCSMSSQARRWCSSTLRTRAARRRAPSTAGSV